MNGLLMDEQERGIAGDRPAKEGMSELEIAQVELGRLIQHAEITGGVRVTLQHIIRRIERHRVLERAPV